MMNETDHDFMEQLIITCRALNITPGEAIGLAKNTHVVVPRESDPNVVIVVDPQEKGVVIFAVPNRVGVI